VLPILEKHVGLVPTYYAAVRLAMHTQHLLILSTFTITIVVSDALAVPRAISKRLSEIFAIF